ncbi:hypothetical protein BXZ70DRAFT_1010002 [Cristinia sonorae]|uniref:DUF6533 domain-containing protein n=1 Tax=Cristinia sonorae TaxID=1940300 RepID=A0A8K0UKP1_9AGAR|nr:hypothetical protein BXZ70DRAFT_1010002 [Cristinia sonorae]
MSAASVAPLPVYVIDALNMGKRSRIAAIALLGYDHFVTLDREVTYIWSARKNNVAFYLYVFNRFFALTYLIFDSVPLTKSGVVSSQVYALYERSRKILIFMLSMCALEIAAMGSLMGVTIGHLEHLPVVSTPTGCFYRGLLNLSALFWVPGLLYEPVLCILVLHKAMSRKHHIPLVVVVARDSLLYFVAIFAILLCSTIIWARDPTYINMVMPWSAALPSILGSRLLLNMREKVHWTSNEKSYIVETIGHSQAQHRDSLTFIEAHLDLQLELELVSNNLHSCTGQC